MQSQRNLLLLVLGLAAAGVATAQSQGALRWQQQGNGAIGLHAGRSDFRLNLQIASTEPTVLDRVLVRNQAQGLSVKFVGKTALLPDFGVYGRVGRVASPSPGWSPDTKTMGAASYGVGLSWDFSPRASAMLGWDAYDFRTVTGERDVRATSLGLQWRY